MSPHPKLRWRRGALRPSRRRSSSTHDARPADGLVLGTPRGRGALLASILGSGMAFLDGTAVNLALPAMGDDLGTGLAGFQWVVNGYMLTFAALVLIGGSLGDRFGPRRIFELGVVSFAVASIMGVSSRERPRHREALRQGREVLREGPGHCQSRGGVG